MEFDTAVCDGFGVTGWPRLAGATWRKSAYRRWLLIWAGHNRNRWRRKSPDSLWCRNVYCVEKTESPPSAAICRHLPPSTSAASRWNLESKSSRWTIDPPPTVLRAAAAAAAKAAYSSTECILFSCFNVFFAKFLTWLLSYSSIKDD